jgi:hypothetical protein
MLRGVIAAKAFIACLSAVCFDLGADAVVRAVFTAGPLCIEISPHQSSKMISLRKV